MKVPFSWLKEFVEIDVTPQELQEKLDDPKKAPDLPEDLVERASDRIVSRILNTGSRNA